MYSVCFVCLHNELWYESTYYIIQHGCNDFVQIIMKYPTIDYMSVLFIDSKLFNSQHITDVDYNYRTMIKIWYIYGEQLLCRWSIMKLWYCY